MTDYRNIVVFVEAHPEMFCGSTVVGLNGVLLGKGGRGGGGRGEVDDTYTYL